jgi:hypothetical protein
MQQSCGMIMEFKPEESWISLKWRTRSLEEDGSRGVSPPSLKSLHVNRFVLRLMCSFLFFIFFPFLELAQSFVSN